MALLLTFTPANTQHPLDTMRDRNRVLLIFGPSSLDDRVRSQLAVLDGKAMAARDLLLIVELEKWDRGDEDLFVKRSSLNTDLEQAYARHRFHIHPNELTVILLGKDGGEKFRSHVPVTIDQLNQIIDAMPMRQEEIRSRPPR